MSSVGIDILEGYSVRVLVVLIVRNLLNVQNRVGGWGGGGSKCIGTQMSLVLLYARLRIVSECGENVDEGCIKNTLFLDLRPAIKQCLLGRFLNAWTHPDCRDIWFI